MKLYKKIAIGIRTLKGGTGASAIVLNTAKYLVSLGFKVDIYANKLNEELIKSYGATPFKIGVFGFSDYQKRKAFANKFEKIVAKKDYDIIIGHGDVLKQDILFLHNVVHLANSLIPNEDDKKIKTIGKIHDEIFKQNSFKYCIANSNLMKNEIISRYHTEKNKIKVIYPGSDLSRFSITEKYKKQSIIREKNKIKKDDIVVGLITSGNFKKRGVEIFLKACNLLNKEFKNIKFLLVGKEKNIESYLSILEPDTKEKLIYYPSYQKIEELFYILDFFVLPAYIEEFGLVVNEAKSCAVVPIISKNVGAGERIKEFREYLILENINEEEIVKKVKNISGNKDLLDKIIKANLEVAKSSSWDVYNKEFEKIVKEAEKLNHLSN